MKNILIDDWKHKILTIDDNSFEEIALELFKYQAKYNLVYKQYLSYLNKDFNKIESIFQIPFLPIDFFKYHKITTHLFEPTHIFESSGTTQTTRSKHFIKNIDFYHQIAVNIFEKMYGKLDNFHILALLPSYLERGKSSSLVSMMDYFIRKTNSNYSGFYLDNKEKLTEKLQYLHQKKDKKIILWGVSFALLDLANEFPQNLENIIIIETGGMKGKGEELTRNELHQKLQKAFKVNQIHSEYGMTELLSQGYALGGDIFQTPAHLKIILREINDPFALFSNQKRGIINVIDLANIDSCGFIATQDLGEITEKGFKVLGRVDNSEARGCNLLMEM
ncbi:MAG: acyl transferase [Cytophagales bacterium]|nr:MAG: acyl transferase [Cytophagales bacterium]TAH30895.1 MAG: acyl transferase [Cytophagales bacterium]